MRLLQLYKNTQILQEFVCECVRMLIQGRQDKGGKGGIIYSLEMTLLLPNIVFHG